MEKLENEITKGMLRLAELARDDEPISSRAFLTWIEKLKEMVQEINAK